MMDQEDVNRVLDNLVSQGDGEKLEKWMMVNMCWKCYQRKYLNEEKR